MKFLFPNSPKLRVMGVFGCTHKTVAMGIPMINAIYEGSPDIGLYTLPLLIWHPMQLLLGTFLAPRLAEFVKREEDRLGITSFLPTATTSSASNFQNNANELSGEEPKDTEAAADQSNGDETDEISKDVYESNVHAEGQSQGV
jgi:sodium/bile acid cotransporter 7